MITSPDFHFWSCDYTGHLQNGKQQKWGRTWKMAPGLKWPKNGHRNGKMAKTWAKPRVGGPFFGHFGGHSFGHFRPGGISIFFRTSLPLGRWPGQTHRIRNPHLPQPQNRQNPFSLEFDEEERICYIKGIWPVSLRFSWKEGPDRAPSYNTHTRNHCFCDPGRHI